MKNTKSKIVGVIINWLPFLLLVIGIVATMFYIAHTTNSYKLDTYEKEIEQVSQELNNVVQLKVELEKEKLESNKKEVMAIDGKIVDSRILDKLDTYNRLVRKYNNTLPSSHNIFPHFVEKPIEKPYLEFKDIQKQINTELEKVSK